MLNQFQKAQTYYQKMKKAGCATQKAATKKAVVKTSSGGGGARNQYKWSWSWYLANYCGGYRSAQTA